jgi:hypothetical protein
MQSFSMDIGKFTLAKHFTIELIRIFHPNEPYYLWDVVIYKTQAREQGKWRCVPDYLIIIVIVGNLKLE